MNNMKKVKNGISYEMNGWLYVSIKGKPRERGYAYGKLIKEDMKEVDYRSFVKGFMTGAAIFTSVGGVVYFLNKL